jgi:hypothetical protein
VTVVPVAAVPVKVGVASLVTLSVDDNPVSLVVARSGVDGAGTVTTAVPMVNV